MKRVGPPLCGHEGPIVARGLCGPCYRAQRQPEDPEKVRARSKARYESRTPAQKQQARENARKWYAANAERVKPKARKYYAEHHYYTPAAHRRRKYGLTAVEFLAKYESQNGLCACCYRPFDDMHAPRGAKGGVYPHVDHDHDTGVVRDLLCGMCNRGLGCFDDNTTSLELAIEYLRKHGAG